MKKFLAFSAVSFAFVAQAVAGTMYISPMNKDVKSYKVNLADVDNVSFSKDREDEPYKLVVNKKNSSLLVGYKETVENLYAFKFVVKPELKETMTVVWHNDKSPETDIEDEYVLSNVESIEIINMDDTDSDGDGLTDYDEIYRYETNPKDRDTDGDGYPDYDEVKTYSSKNPTLWNPKVADLPELTVELRSLPALYLIKVTTSGTSETTTITEGESQTSSQTVNQSFTTSASQQSGWKVGYGVTVTGNFGAETGYLGPKFSVAGTVSNEWNGSSTYSQGATFGGSQQSAIAKSYQEAKAAAVNSSQTITGGKARMFVNVKNTGHIAYNVGGLSLVLSAYTADGSVQPFVYATPENPDDNFQLKQGEVSEVKMQEVLVPVGVIEQFSRNPGALFISSTGYKLTTTKELANFIGSNDFTENYTKVAAKTAAITFDYGPKAPEGVKRYLVSTQFKRNEESVGLEDQYLKTTLKDIFDILHVQYEEGSMKFGEGENQAEHNGLISVGDASKYTYDEENKHSMWYISVIRAATPSVYQIYAIKSHDLKLEDVEVNNGDEIRVFYSKDEDNDGLSSYEEALLGTDDTKPDTDGDGKTDYEEVRGWYADGYVENPTEDNPSTCQICGPFKTNPVQVDSDFDGLADYNDPAGKMERDPDPINRKLSSYAKIENVVVAGRTATVVDVGGKCKEVAEECTEGSYESVECSKEEACEKKSVCKIEHCEGEGENQVCSVEEKSPDCVDYESQSNWRLAEALRELNVVVSFKTNPTVDNVVITRKGKEIIPNKSTLKDNTIMYSLTIDTLDIGMDTINVSVVSENKERTSINRIIIDGSLDALEAPYLVTTPERNSIKVEWKPLKDKRIKGYVVLRGEGSRYYSNYVLANKKGLELPAAPKDKMFVEGQKVEDNVIVKAVINKPEVTEYVDEVGGGSPYYTYRVYAYAEQDGKPIFTRSKGYDTRSVGRILVKFKAVSVGAEYLWCYSKAGRYDMRVEAFIYTGRTLQKHYNYWFQNAGSAYAGNTVIWQDKADDASRDEDSNDIQVDQNEHEVDMGAEGLLIEFTNNADIRNDVLRTSAEVQWSYDAFVNALKVGTPKNYEAPKNDFKEMTFTWGDGGLSHDESCKSCGDEPHSGYKLKFKYDYID